LPFSFESLLAIFPLCCTVHHQKESVDLFSAVSKEYQTGSY